MRQAQIIVIAGLFVMAIGVFVMYLGWYEEGGGPTPVGAATPAATATVALPQAD
jgi:hypothetical protein